jgi:hypothetical protein
MRSLSLWSSIIPLAALLDVSLAIHIDLNSRSTNRLPNLFARATNATSGLDFGNGGYYINITLGGAPFAVMIDTGRWVVFNSSPSLSPHPRVLTEPTFPHHVHLSSDLWVAGTVPGAVNTGSTASVTYAVGSAQGMRAFRSTMPESPQLTHLCVFSVCTQAQ